jgi:phage shock protein PspC (stress-responsive transcriptional regulator)
MVLESNTYGVRVTVMVLGVTVMVLGVTVIVYVVVWSYQRLKTPT